MENYKKNIETPNISTWKLSQEELAKIISFDIENYFPTKEILSTFGNSILLSNWYRAFLDKYESSVKSFVENFKSLNKNSYFSISLFRKLENIYIDTFQAVTLLYNNVFKFFFTKWFTTKAKKNLYFKNIFWENSYSWNNFKEILTQNFSDSEFQLLKDIYFMGFVYQINYLNWLIKIYRLYEKKLKDISTDKLSLIQEISHEISDRTSEDFNILFPQIFCLLCDLDIEKIEIIKKYLVANRYKKLDSALFKILKKEKYFSQFIKESILADQYGILLYIDDLSILQDLAEYFKKLYDNPGEDFKVNKYNDRWVIEKNHDNNETSKYILPFVNIWLINGDVSLWEISCRLDYKVRLKEILDEFSSKKKVNKLKFLTRLVEEIDAFNHEIYKVSQEIKILRKLFLDKKVIPDKRNLKNSAEKFLNYKIKFLIDDLKDKLAQHNLGDKFRDDEIKIVVVNHLYEQVKLAIMDLAWERFKPILKESNLYKSLSYNKKKEFLKKFSTKVSTAVYKKNKQIKWYWPEGNKLYKEFVKIYNEIIDTSIFYPYLSWEKEKLSSLTDL